MNPWNTESVTFAHWLGRQGEPAILPNQVNVVVNIVDRMDNGDLISVLYQGNDASALAALKVLRHRFEDEMYWLDQMNQSQYPEDEDATTDWG